MKRILLVLFCLTSLFASAQMTLKKLDGTPINDGDVLSFQAATDPESYLGIKVYNSSVDPIYMKVKVVSITNADGTNIQLCFNVCYNTIIAGNSYPNIPVVIDGNNGTNGNFDHFLNMNGGINTTQPVEYRFKFYQLNDAGLEIGNAVTFTYRFNSSLSINDFVQLQKLGVTLLSNVIYDDLELSTLKNTEATLIDLSGKVLQHQYLSIGNHSISLSKWPSGLYVLQFKNEEEQLVSVKIIKK